MGKSDDQKPPPVERPDRKDAHLTMRVPEEWVAEAEKRARKSKRSLLEVIRAFIYGYGLDEFPEPPPYPGEGRRAKKRSKKKSESE